VDRFVRIIIFYGVGPVRKGGVGGLWPAHPSKIQRKGLPVLYPTPRNGIQAGQVPGAKGGKSARRLDKKTVSIDRQRFTGQPQGFFRGTVPIPLITGCGIPFYTEIDRHMGPFNRPDPVTGPGISGSGLGRTGTRGLSQGRSGTSGLSEG